MLRENIYAERDQPPFDRVAMDGVALASQRRRAAGGERFRLQATQAAGEPPLQLSSPENCIEVMTGAVLPGGCDTVVPVERLQQRRRLGRDRGEASAACGRGRTCTGAASDSAQGALLLAAGSVLHAPEIAVAASAGMARVRVSSQPAIMVISTGNELVEPGDPIAPHQIRRSNAYAVVAALRQRGFQRVADDHLPDDEALLRERLRLHLDTHEVLILSGGVSMGRFDLVPEGARGHRRALRAARGRAAPRQADVVWHLERGSRGIRVARQSGLDAGVPGALRDAGAVRRHGHAAQATGERVALVGADSMGSSS